MTYKALAVDFLKIFFSFPSILLLEPDGRVPSPGSFFKEVGRSRRVGERATAVYEYINT